MKVSVQINGTMQAADVEPRMLLVDFIRDVCRLTGTKNGCESGQCGSCTVHLDGKSVKACMLLAVQADGCRLTTVEGLATNGELHPLQQAFQRQHAVQTGYSTPGMLMSMADLLQRDPQASDEEIRDWLEGHITRDTGYQNVLQAVADARDTAGTVGGHGTAESLAADSLAAGERPFGASVACREHPDFLRGDAKFVADLTLPNMLHAAILHSTEAHAIIRTIDTSAAAEMPGVVRVFTGADVEHLMPLPSVWMPADAENHFPPHPLGSLPGAQPVLAQERVRYIGEHVAVVVAESRQQAYDALDAIKVEYDPLPVVVDAEEALRDGAPRLHEWAPSNLSTHAIRGDKDAAERALGNAEVVVEHTLYNQRLIHNAEETRGSIGSYDPHTKQYTLWTNTQIPHANRLLISQYVLGIPYSDLRVIVPHIGGSYGSKGYCYATEPLVLFLSQQMGRPVKWVDTRWGLSRSTVHARDQRHHVKLAGTRDGRITCLYCRCVANMGAYPATNGASPPVLLTGRSITGAYAIPHPCYEVHTAYTNTVPVGPMRGAGRSEAIFLIERMIELYAREIGIDPAEVRRKNMVPPDQFPYENGLGWTYDTGNYQAALDKALKLVGYEQKGQMQADALARGRRLGIGMASYVAVGGVGPSPRMGREGMIGSVWASAHVNVHPNGEVAITTGSQPHGQSHETTFSQVAADVLGIPLDKIRLLHSDTRGTAFGQGSYGSRSFSVEGAVIYNACQKIVAKARRAAAHMLKVPEESVVYEAGSMHVKGKPDKVSFADVAMALWLAWDLPPGMEPGLEVIAYFDPQEFNFPFGTHAAVVEIDEQTGNVDVVRYVAVDDFGNVGNPAVVDGQTHGNIVQGIGAALLEECVFDSKGQLATSDFHTYAMPRASCLPELQLERTVTPTPHNAMGAKGAGDVANTAVAPAIVNAACDALHEFGVKHIEMPLWPEKVWRLMQERRD